MSANNAPINLVVRRFTNMAGIVAITATRKITIIILGYLLAFLAASAATYVYIWSTPGVDRQTYSGMSAFGDSMLFIALLGVASLPACGATLFFLRGYRPFWVALSVAGIALACTGLAALLVLLAPNIIISYPWLRTWELLSPIRVLLAPLFAVAFFLAGLLAPDRSSRITLFLVAGNEVAVFSLTVLQWIQGH